MMYLRGADQGGVRRRLWFFLIFPKVVGVAGLSPVAAPTKSSRIDPTGFCLFTHSNVTRSLVVRIVRPAGGKISPVGSTMLL